MNVEHFVTFLSPGTLVSEKTIKEIDSWNPDKAMEMAHEIIERYNATPYGFYFTTRTNSKETAQSCMYFLGGEVLTLQQIKDRGGSHDSILIVNMENNGYDRVIENTNSWRVTLPLDENDIVLEYSV